MSDLLPLKEHIIYGPVRSRRLGRSLGINLLPPGEKWCTFDCLYCQYGLTPSIEGALSEKRRNIPSVENVVQAVETALRELDEPPAYLTFSGNGEPTLHPDFPRIVEAVRILRDRLVPDAKTALLSNSSRTGEAIIRAAISRLDRPILKLDAGNEIVFRSFSRPRAEIRYDDIIAGLEAMRGITLQSLFCAGPHGNLEEDHIADWIDKVKQIWPRDVQIYTISRPVPTKTLEQAPAAAMLGIRDRVQRAGIPAGVF